jgi:spore coat polysaccharide biosynthesis protein SpsF
MPRVVASIEARMRSSRLPGKVLADIGGTPAIGRLVARLRRARLVDDIVLATTVDRSDDPLAAWAEAAGVALFRGSEEDVLLRVVEAHRMARSDVIVEVTGDCPLLDPEVIDLGVDTFLANDCDVVANVARPAFPQGVDVQVFRLALLEGVERDVQDPAVREHVSLFFYEHPERYRILHLMAPLRYRGADYRFQLDYEEDLAFIRAVYAELEPTLGPAFGTPEVLALLARRPDLAAINCERVEKPVR